MNSADPRFAHAAQQSQTSVAEGLLSPQRDQPPKLPRFDAIRERLLDLEKRLHQSVSIMSDKLTRLGGIAPARPEGKAEAGIPTAENTAAQIEASIVTLNGLMDWLAVEVSRLGGL